VGSIERIGSVEREIRVGLDRSAAGVGLTAPSKPAAARQQRRPRRDGRKSSARSDNPYPRGAKRLLSWRDAIALPSGGEVQLDDLGLVTDTVADNAPLRASTERQSSASTSCARRRQRRVVANAVRRD